MTTDAEIHKEAECAAKLISARRATDSPPKLVRLISHLASTHHGWDTHSLTVGLCKEHCDRSWRGRFAASLRGEIGRLAIRQRRLEEALAFVEICDSDSLDDALEVLVDHHDVAAICKRADEIVRERAKA
jgi:hypothetical protein